MSDLNQKIRAAKSGHVDEDGIRLLIDMWKSLGMGPLCCFYTMQRKRLESEHHEGYIELADFRMAECDQDEMVVGCSRGCVPYRDFTKDHGIYGSRLCEGCVAEALKYVKEK